MKENWVESDPSDIAYVSYETLDEYKYRIEELENTVAFYKEICEELIQNIEEFEQEEITTQDLFDTKDYIKKDLDKPNI